MFEIFQYNFMVNAVMASVLASIAFGIVGTYVVVKRIVFISGGIAHTAYGGIGLAFFVGINPFWGAIAFAVGAAFFISIVRRWEHQHEDTLIGIMWALGMAVGVILIGLTPGYVPNLMSYLFGNILTIPTIDIWGMLLLDVIIISFVVIFFKEFQAITFDEEYSRAIGLPVDNLYLLLLVLIAITTVILIKLVGIILVVALLAIPASISIHFVKSIKSMMVLSSILGIIFTISGLLLSYYLNLAAGATIIIVSVICYFASSLLRKLLLNKNISVSN
ncbi:metal ABC transporter permease [Bacteroidota bacterium]